MILSAEYQVGSAVIFGTGVIALCHYFCGCLFQCWRLIALVHFTIRRERVLVCSQREIFFKFSAKKKARNKRAKQQVEDDTSKNPGNM
jgi:hypothetical protein